MGNFGGSLGGHFTLHADVYEISSNIPANFSTVRMDLYMLCDSTGTGEWNLTGSANYQGNVNGNAPGGNFNFDFRGNNNTIHLLTFDTNCGHDANGNASIGWAAGCNADNAPSLTTSNISGGLGLGRLPLAPTFNSLAVNTIKPTTANLTATFSTYGHGTSGSMEMYYRLQGDVTWISLGSQGYSGGNVWTPTGLKPGKVYEYICNGFNNNGDFAQTGTQSFKTTPVSSMISVIKAMI